MKTILVTGGAGYIGSHTCVELLNAGYNVVVIDNLCNSKKKSLEKIEEITNLELKFIEGDILDINTIEDAFKQDSIHAVIHFAGLKSVSESIKLPVQYYFNNVVGTLNLLQVMQKYEVKKLVFSSSAVVYGGVMNIPIKENSILSPINPYGKSKLIIEGMLNDLHESDHEWHIVILRYFNPAGAHSSGKLGEDPNNIPNNLMPYISQVAMGRMNQLPVYGNDYPTRDGTCIRDYIHVVDLANGHIKALEKLESGTGISIYNLGSGKGHTVYEVIYAFERASGKKINCSITGRRKGDVAESIADPSLAFKEINWKTEFKLSKMCEDMWRWINSI